MPDPGVTVVWDDRLLDYNFGPEHPFTERSRWLAVRLLAELERRAESTVGALRWRRRVSLAGTPELERFHRRSYLELVQRLDGSGSRAPLDAGDTPAFPGCFDASRRLVGATLLGIDSAMNGNGPAFAPGGGLHHAHPDRASGFCIFNDIAVGIAGLLADHSAERIAYVDIDAHHGDGVMYGFFEDGRVLDIDFHQDGRTLFPGTGFASEVGRGDGAGAKVNLPLPPGTGDRDFLRLFDRIVPPLLRDFRPELVILQCGVDGHTGDRLGGTALELTPRTYVRVVTELNRVLHDLSAGALVVTGGGGYSAENVARVLACVPLWLLGAAPEPSAPLPGPWRAEFERHTGWPAPADWTVDARPVAWAGPTEERLTSELEAALGRRFPAGSGTT
ncbi:MAG TPA: acetoin utilization protein AcuC [Thermoplasmata archaeon]|nr:acetoin utilization protein AcuC [Thermoplasmata archaeon]